MNKTIPNTTDMLLPLIFRKAGEVMTFVMAVAVILIRITWPAYMDKSPVYNMIISAMFITGLFFMAWSREKQDDEQMRLYRLKATKVSLFCCVIYFFVMASLYTTGIHTVPQIRGMEQIIGLLLIYQSVYLLQKNVFK